MGCAGSGSQCAPGKFCGDNWVNSALAALWYSESLRRAIGDELSIRKRLPMPWSLAPTVHRVSIFPIWMVLRAEHQPQRQQQKTGVSGISLGLDVMYPATISTLLYLHPVFFRVWEDTC